MAKHIDADQLIKVLRRLRDKGELLIGISEVMYTIDDMPAADVEEVVRCKDCKHTDLFYPYCTIWEAAIDGDGYCYKGEKE